MLALHNGQQRLLLMGIQGPTSASSPLREGIIKLITGGNIVRVTRRY